MSESDTNITKGTSPHEYKEILGSGVCTEELKRCVTRSGTYLHDENGDAVMGAIKVGNLKDNRADGTSGVMSISCGASNTT